MRSLFWLAVTQLLEFGRRGRRDGLGNQNFSADERIVERQDPFEQTEFGSTRAEVSMPIPLGFQSILTKGLIDESVLTPVDGIGNLVGNRKPINCDSNQVHGLIDSQVSGFDHGPMLSVPATLCAIPGQDDAKAPVHCLV